jgi:hypothetical protein
MTLIYYHAKLFQNPKINGLSIAKDTAADQDSVHLSALPMLIPPRKIPQP